MRIYLAARYSRRLELCHYREQIEALGHEVQARWLDGEHQISDRGAPIGVAGEALVEGDDGASSDEAARLRRQFAEEDIRDIQACDLLIAFTEPPHSTASRGGRHVELGIAIALQKKVWIVGPRENIFCWLVGLIQLDGFDEALEILDSVPRDQKGHLWNLLHEAAPYAAADPDLYARIQAALDAGHDA